MVEVEEILLKTDIGWRICLGLTVIPNLIITLCSLFLPGTPNPLIDHGHNDATKDMLRSMHGILDIDQEYTDLVAASEVSKVVEKLWRNIPKRKYRSPLMMVVMILFFQQLTGINVNMFYLLVLFKTIRLGDQASLLSSVITGLVNLIVTFLSIFTVDRLGRRFLFLDIVS
ncbi:Sugar carrier protein C [Acorus calamus]|uniref:Sugar carrier protein C n=1 Tax=Acorus calamus TaxID=4465 RepID=A0AAV9CDV8_ACOCL|nr:Sugar carrier protein C [Acorus calamus]